MSEAFYYTFPAIRGIQAGMEYYISMCPLKLIPKIFLFNEEELQPEMRAQRVLNKSRIPEMSNYIVNNSDSYVFSSLTVSIDAQTEFAPATDDPSLYNIGHLKVPMTAKFIINDGQHRRAAIEAAIKKKPELGDETISIVFFIDLGLRKSQQMFSDLNRYAIRPTKSLNILFDNRTPFSVMVKELALEVPIFKNLVEKEKSTISNRSIELFTLSGIHRSTKQLLRNKQNLDLSEQKKIAFEFWHEVGNNIEEWQLVKKKKISAASLRKDYINAHSIALVALGIVGSALIDSYPDQWKCQLKNLQSINWNRSNTSVWEGRVTTGGRINATNNNTKLLANYIKQVLGLKLENKENELEQIYLEKVGKNEQ